jgi:hypothetical protein
MNTWNAENKKRKIGLNLSFTLLFLLLAGYCFPFTVHAQEEEPPADAVPPPVRTLSQDEKKLLEAETGIKKRTQLSLDLMDARIAKSEKLLAENNFSASLNELGIFHGLLDNALNYLVKNDNGDKSVDKNFKTFEIYLRKQVPRLESIRREMPFKYGYYVQTLMRAVREARSKAVEPLFDNTVVPNNKP